MTEEIENSKSFSTKDKMFQCKLCRSECPDIESYVNHLESRDHKKELMKEKYGAKYLEAKAKLDNTSRKTKLPEKKSPKTMADPYQDCSKSREKEGDVYTCEVCRKICTGFITYQMHLKGKNHEKCVNKAELLRKLKENNLMPKAKTEKPPEEQLLLVMIMSKTEYASQDIECEIWQKIYSGWESHRHHCESSVHRKKIAITNPLDEMTSDQMAHTSKGDGSQFASGEVGENSYSPLLHMVEMRNLIQAENKKELPSIKDDSIINDEKELSKIKNPINFDEEEVNNDQEELSNVKVPIIKDEEKLSNTKDPINKIEKVFSKNKHPVNNDEEELSNIKDQFIKDDPRELQCKECGKSFKDQASFYAHLQNQARIRNIILWGGLTLLILTIIFS